MVIATWVPVPCPDGIRMAFHAHIHGREVGVCVCEGDRVWHWRITSPTGHLLAEGTARDREAAEQAAEDEIFAIHPPSAHLLDDLLG